MSFKSTSSKNNVYEMNNSSLDLSYTLGLSYIIDWSATAGLGYVYEGKGAITSGSTAIKYETESVSGFGLFGLLGIEWEDLEGLIGLRYYSVDYTDFISTNTSEQLGVPLSISSAQLIFGLGYKFWCKLTAWKIDNVVQTIKNSLQIISKLRVDTAILSMVWFGVGEFRELGGK